MSNNPNQLVQKLWNYCNILRDDGLSYGVYVEQLTFLLFLKMADEAFARDHHRPLLVKVEEPSRCSEESNQRRDAAATVRHIWPNLLAKDAEDFIAVAREVST